MVGNSTDTPGPVSAVVGTLVCNPGTQTVAILDTTSVTLNVRGDAEFSGLLQNIPVTCANPLFLVRIAAPAGAAGRWIGTGTERLIGVDHFVVFAMARPVWPRHFFARWPKERALAGRGKALRHQNWTERVTTGSRLSISLRLLSQHARSF